MKYYLWIEYWVGWNFNKVMNEIIMLFIGNYVQFLTNQDLHTRPNHDILSECPMTWLTKKWARCILQWKLLLKIQKIIVPKVCLWHNIYNGESSLILYRHVFKKMVCRQHIRMTLVYFSKIMWFYVLRN